MSEKKMPYAPGSKEAVNAGCTCPVIDNCYGGGAYTQKDGTPVFWYDKSCPLHGKAEEIRSETILFKKEK